MICCNVAPPILARRQRGVYRGFKGGWEWEIGNWGKKDGEKRRKREEWDVASWPAPMV